MALAPMPPPPPPHPEPRPQAVAPANALAGGGGGGGGHGLAGPWPSLAYPGGKFVFNREAVADLKLLQAIGNRKKPARVTQYKVSAKIAKIDECGTNPQAASIAAHCDLHGCRVNRVVAKQPVGYLAARLESQNDYATREEHMQARLDRSDMGPLSIEKRRAARDRVRADPALSSIFVWEGGGHEAPEPEILPR